MIVLGGTFVLDLAVAVQAFGRRPSVFSKIRDEPEPPYEIGVCGLAPTPTSLGFTMSDLKPVDWITGADTVVVPGLEAPWAPQDPAVLAAVARAAADGARLVSLCAGAFVLGQAGVLDGRRVTTHWALADEFRAAFPRADLVEHALYVDDGQILSSGGMLASADLCLYVLGQDHGQSYANDVSRVLVSPPHRTGGQAQYVKSGPRPSGPLSPVLDWLDEHLAEPLSLGHVAAQAHMSQRTLVRRFREETGDSLSVWIARRRVERARALLEDSRLTVTQIAHTAGFGSTESMRRHFLTYAGTTPRAYRDTFRGGMPATSAR
ncbi:GlxA family transcriptional regulator [Jiangella alkaliphila]|uniref:Transcriptional regulator GlxA family, contains an amidase domain and an AraC-type DNA-binding HTH domain n=1 Tax=Jiangella alkaliphila TaxID=419479 RepID=A0A1H2KX56_9ACTN|nr:helix-turn-helix domain-containing protein [Jiangella alkaliphila]SDU73279.1 Transcriptional regulator GlxA family, contains an amidase domain and an AraC-type DNA-binding HTH domain [Jiangella alkaliphila]